MVVALVGVRLVHVDHPLTWLRLSSQCGLVATGRRFTDAARRASDALALVMGQLATRKRFDQSIAHSLECGRPVARCLSVMCRCAVQMTMYGMVLMDGLWTEAKIRGLITATYLAVWEVSAGTYRGASSLGGQELARPLRAGPSLVAPVWCRGVQVGSLTCMGMQMANHNHGGLLMLGKSQAYRRVSLIRQPYRSGGLIFTPASRFTGHVRPCPDMVHGWQACTR